MNNVSIYISKYKIRASILLWMQPNGIYVTVSVLGLLICYINNDKVWRNNSEENKCNAKCVMPIYVSNSGHGSYLFVHFKAKYLWTCKVSADMLIFFLLHKIRHVPENCELIKRVSPAKYKIPDIFINFAADSWQR